MIHYQLRCASAHEFDGWFRDSAGFDEQAVAGLLECPSCGSTQVERALMAPSVPRKGRDIAVDAVESLAVEDAVAEPDPAPVAAPVLPDAMRAMLQRMRAEVERQCDYVGPDFADEARRIHHGESEPRVIYGETTPGEAEALADEGIEFGQVPWVPRAES
jgi:hypothetical protein